MNEQDAFFLDPADRPVAEGGADDLFRDEALTALSADHVAAGQRIGGSLRRTDWPQHSTLPFSRMPQLKPELKRSPPLAVSDVKVPAGT